MSWRDRARTAKRDAYAMYFAVRDPRTPLFAKLLALAVVAYALSPIDLIPDFIPVAGQLDDLLIVPLGVALALRYIPPEVMADSRAKVAAAGRLRRNVAGAIVIVALWVAALVLVVRAVAG